MKGDFTRHTFDPEKRYSAVLEQQGRVRIDADQREGVEIAGHLRRTALRDVVGITGAPAESPGFRLSVGPQGDLIIGAGRYYVDGILCENVRDVLFTEQPDLPGQSLPSAAGRFLAYLDVWERHITAIEDPEIREVALGGPDTTTRKQTVCGVRLFQVAENAHCLSPLPRWARHVAPGDGRLSARAQPPEDSDPLCRVPPGAGFTGLENQLYRVEIHQGGEPGEATFKWSRDNASVAFPIVEFLDGLPTDRLRLGNAAPARLHSLRRDSEIEITDDGLELNGEPGLLRRVDSIDPATGIVTLAEQVDGLSRDRHPKIRLWSSGEDGGETAAAFETDTFIPLESGVQVRFEGSRFRTRDHWAVPARTATGDVQWPSTIQDDGGRDPLPRPPLGIEHHYCRLALVDLGDDGLSVVADCRNIFPALTGDTLKIARVESALSNRVLPHNGLIRAENLPAGLNFVFSSPLSENVFASSEQEGQLIHPAVEVRLFLPDPAMPADHDFWQIEAIDFFGFRPVILASDLSFVDGQRDRLRWRPNEPTRIWLLRLFSRLVPPGQNRPVVDRLLCTVRVRGGFVWADRPGGGRAFLDGETAAAPHRRSGLLLPSGNGRPGGDFYAWFWIVAGDVEVPLLLFVDVRLNVISGLVSSGGAPVENATVTLRRISGPGPQPADRTTQTDAEGQFSFTALEGRYEVTAEALDASDSEEVEVRPSIVTPGGGRQPGGGGPGNLGVGAVSGIGDSRRLALESNGVRTINEFLALPLARIMEILSVSENQANRLLANARERLNEP